MRRFPKQILLPAIIALHLTWALWSASWYAVAVDEPAMLGGGLWTWQTGGSEIYPHTPPLTKLLAALPYYVAGYRLEFDPSLAMADRPEWLMGLQVLHDSGWDWRLILASRCALMPFSVLAVIVAWRWAGELAGTPAAVLASLGWAVYPPALTWTAVATADSAVASMYLVCAYFGWRLYRQPTLQNGWLAGLALGVGLLVKSTLLILLVLVPVAMIVRYAAGSICRVGGWARRCWTGQQAVPRVHRLAVNAVSGRGSEDTRPLASLVLFFVAALTVLWCGYLGDGFGEPLGSVRSLRFGRITLEKFLSDHLDRPKIAAAISGAPMPVPRDFLIGAFDQWFDAQRDWGSHFAGAPRKAAWWWHGAVYAIKTPVGYYLLVLLALERCLRHPKILMEMRHPLAFLMLASLVLLILVSSMGFRTFWRYSLGFMAPVMIAVSSVLFARGTDPRNAWRMALCGGCVLLVLLEVGGDLPRLHSRVNWPARCWAPSHHWLSGYALDYRLQSHLVLQWARRNPEKRPLYCELPARYGLQPNPYFPQGAVELTTLDAELVAGGLPTGWYVMNLANRFQTHWRRTLTDLQAVEELGDNYRVYYVPGAEQLRSAGNVDVPRKRPETR